MLFERLWCSNCNAVFYRQQVPVYNNEKGKYIICPYCREHKIYINKKSEVENVLNG